MSGGFGSNLQSLASNIGGMTGTVQANVPASLQSLFGPGLNNISTHVNSAEFQSQFSADLANAQKSLNENLPAAIDGFNQGVRGIPSQIADAKNAIGSHLTANPGSIAKKPSFSNITNSSSFIGKAGLET